MRISARPVWEKIRRRVQRLLVLIANFTVYPLSSLSPRSSRSWAFGTTHDLFAGNAKYLFLWISIHRPDLRATWISGSREVQNLLEANGYRARTRWSPGGILAALRSKVFVFTHHVADVNLRLSRKAVRLNLWHGVGLKALYAGRAIRRRKIEMQSRTLLGRLRRWDWQPIHLVTTSDMMQEHFAGQFRRPKELCPQIGYSRLDTKFDPALAAASSALDRQLGFEFPRAFDEVYIYMPTFRDSERPFLATALPDLERLSAVLAKRNALLYIKPHLRTKEVFPAGWDNIRRWPDAIDFHTYLSAFAGLITDYSSVLYDYLFVRDTGAILYTFDLDAYMAQDRELAFPFEENVAGLRVSTFDALCAALEDGSALDPGNFADVPRLRERFWGGSLGPASPAIVEYVERKLLANKS